MRGGDAAAELWETKEAAAELANKEGGLRMRREGGRKQGTKGAWDSPATGNSINGIYDDSIAADIMSSPSDGIG